MGKSENDRAIPGFSLRPAPIAQELMNRGSRLALLALSTGKTNS
jgi:hypothetical protein